jgi:hypothetical protein
MAVSDFFSNGDVISRLKAECALLLKDKSDCAIAFIIPSLKDYFYPIKIRLSGELFICFEGYYSGEMCTLFQHYQQLCVILKAVPLESTPHKLPKVGF